MLVVILMVLLLLRAAALVQGAFVTQSRRLGCGSGSEGMEGRGSVLDVGTGHGDSLRVCVVACVAVRGVRMSNDV